MIYTQDHEPAHVHVWKAGNEAIVHVGVDPCSPELRVVHGMPRRDVKIALRIVNEQLAVLREAWERIHGEVAHQ